jgi:hypothetical protein
LFVRPKFREKFNSLFRDVLCCKVIEHDFGLPHPVLFVPLSDGSGFSVEFTEAAPEDYPGTALDDEHAFRGAWIEFRTNNLPGLQQKLRDAGIREFQHPGSTHVYFSAPGGQVFRLLDVSYKGP